MPGKCTTLGGGESQSVMEVVAYLQKLIGFEDHQVIHVAERPGHDHRYALDDTKLQKAFGWQPSTSLTDGLLKTIRAFQFN